MKWCGSGTVSVGETEEASGRSGLGPGGKISGQDPSHFHSCVVTGVQGDPMGEATKMSVLCPWGEP